MTDELVGKMQTTTQFTLTRPTVGRWFGLNPYMRPLPFPLMISLLFPDGGYEIGYDGDATRWRYLGPHFSTHGTHEQRGNMLIPVGFVGEYCFGGQWNPGGRTLKPTDVGSAPSPEWLANHNKYLAKEQKAYADAAANLQQGRIGPVLRWMTYVAKID